MADAARSGTTSPPLPTIKTGTKKMSRDLDTYFEGRQAINSPGAIALDFRWGL